MAAVKAKKSRKVANLPQNKAYAVADWRNPAEYLVEIVRRAQQSNPEHYRKFLNNFSDKQIARYCEHEHTLWRWEFLRRLPEYQKDFLKYRQKEDRGKKPDFELMSGRYGIYLAPPDPRVLKRF